MASLVGGHGSWKLPANTKHKGVGMRKCDFCGASVSDEDWISFERRRKDQPVNEITGYKYYVCNRCWKLLRPFVMFPVELVTSQRFDAFKHRK